MVWAQPKAESRPISCPSREKCPFLKPARSKQCNACHSSLFPCIRSTQSLSNTCLCSSWAKGGEIRNLPGDPRTAHILLWLNVPQYKTVFLYPFCQQYLSDVQHFSLRITFICITSFDSATILYSIFFMIIIFHLYYWNSLQTFCQFFSCPVYLPTMLLLEHYLLK